MPVKHPNASNEPGENSDQTKIDTGSAQLIQNCVVVVVVYVVVVVIPVVDPRNIP